MTCYISWALGTKPRYVRGERGHIPNPFPRLLCAPCLSGNPLKRRREGISTSLLGKEGITDSLNKALHIKGSIFYKGKKEKEKWQRKAIAPTMVLEEMGHLGADDACENDPQRDQTSGDVLTHPAFTRKF